MINRRFSFCFLFLLFSLCFPIVFLCFLLLSFCFPFLYFPFCFVMFRLLSFGFLKRGLLLKSKNFLVNRDGTKYLVDLLARPCQSSSIG